MNVYLAAASARASKANEIALGTVTRDLNFCRSMLSRRRVPEKVAAGFARHAARVCEHARNLSPQLNVDPTQRSQLENLVQQVLSDLADFVSNIANRRGCKVEY